MQEIIRAQRRVPDRTDVLPDLPKLAQGFTAVFPTRSTPTSTATLSFSRKSLGRNNRAGNPQWHGVVGPEPRASNV
jgi:hypothetical protein